MLFSLNTRTPQRKKRVAKIVKELKEKFGNSISWEQELETFITFSIDMNVVGYVDAVNNIFHIWDNRTQDDENKIKLDIPLKECDTIYSM